MELPVYKDFEVNETILDSFNVLEVEVLEQQVGKNSFIA